MIWMTRDDGKTYSCVDVPEAGENQLDERSPLDPSSRSVFEAIIQWSYSGKDCVQVGFEDRVV